MADHSTMFGLGDVVELRHVLGGLCRGRVRRILLAPDRQAAYYIVGEFAKGRPMESWYAEARLAAVLTNGK